MGFRVPRWLRALVVPLLVFAAAVVALVRSQRFKDWLIGQYSVPHGPFGRVLAEVMAHPNRHFRDVHTRVAELLDLRTDDRLLEVGCGPGAFLDGHGKSLDRVAGIDASLINVSLAKRRLADRIASGTAEIIHGDSARLPWDDETFTAAACPANLVLFPDPKAVLVELHRVLERGGRLAVAYGIDDTDEACVREYEWWGWTPPPEDEVRKAVEDAGFSLVSVSYMEEGYLARYVTGIKPA